MHAKPPTERIIESPAPAFRTDLKLSRQVQRGNVVYVIKDPRLRTFFRVSDVEYELLRRMDGARTPAQVLDNYAMAFGHAVSEERLQSLIRRIHTFRLFKEDMAGLDGALGARGSSRSRLSVRLFLIRLRIIDPDAFLARLVGKTGFLFTLPFVAAASLCILAGLVLAMLEWSALGARVNDLFRLRALVVLWLVVSVVIALHELAHALTCRHYGGEVHDMGLCLYYFQPCLYTNVSDSYLFEAKRARLWVLASGGFFQALIWALAVMGWVALDGHGLAGEICLIVVVTAGIGTLFNFNPLLKYDGYYLLSEVVEIPNLRRKAFTFLGGRLPWKRGGERTTARESVGRGERRVYWWYGSFAMGYSALFLAYLAWGAVRLLSHLLER